MAKRESKGNPSPPAPLELPAGVKLLRTLRGHTDRIGRIAWSPDGRMLASPSVDKTIRLWDGGTGECLRTIDGHKDTVWAVAFDLAGHTLASASHDKTVKLWELSSGRLLRTLEGHNGGVVCVAFDKAGRTLASSSHDGEVKLWQVASGRLLRGRVRRRGGLSECGAAPTHGYDENSNPSFHRLFLQTTCFGRGPSTPTYSRTRTTNTGPSAIPPRRFARRIAGRFP